MEFKRLTPLKRYEEVVEQIKQAVYDGKMVIGDKLPSENEMVQQFGVSRSVVREALRSLEQIGLVEVRQGASGGTFVGDKSIGKMTEVFTVMLNLDRFRIEHVYQVAHSIETTAAELAAINAGPNDLALLEQNLLDHYRLESPAEDRPTLGFHTALAKASGNPLLETLVNVLINVVRRNPVLYPSQLDFPEESNQDHVAILEAVKKHDGPEARRLMSEHLHKIEEAVLAAQSRSLVEDLREEEALVNSKLEKEAG